MARVSALLDTQQISDITGIESEDSEWGLTCDNTAVLTLPQHSYAPSTPATPS